MNQDVMHLIGYALDRHSLVRWESTCQSHRAHSRLMWQSLVFQDFPGLESHRQPFSTHWKEYYKQRYISQQTHLKHAQSSILNHLYAHLDVCHLSPLVYACANSSLDYTLAHRFLIRGIYEQIQCASQKPLPLITEIIPLEHPCIVQVMVKGVQRDSFLCFTETMQIVDPIIPYQIEKCFQRLLDCNERGNPQPWIKQMTGAEILDRIFQKQQTLIQNHPHGICTFLDSL